jgi:hypothetical protein
MVDPVTCLCGNLLERFQEIIQYYPATVSGCIQYPWKMLQKVLPIFCKNALINCFFYRVANSFQRFSEDCQQSQAICHRALTTSWSSSNIAPSTWQGEPFNNISEYLKNSKLSLRKLIFYTPPEISNMNVLTCSPDKTRKSILLKRILHLSLLMILDKIVHVHVHNNKIRLE